MPACRWSIAVVFVGAAAIASAQDPPSRPSLDEPPVPAQLILNLREELQLSDSQVTRLTTLATTQTAAVSRATAMFLRADADLLDASRGDDIAIRRAALEKRAKIAIDAEVARLQAEKSSRALLTAEQLAKLTAIRRPQQAGWGASEASVWQHLVTPPRVSRMRAPDAVPDSGEVRISDIFVDDVKVGSGKKFLTLVVGQHAVKLQAVGCVEVVLPIAVHKGEVQVLPQQILSCSR